MDLSSSKPGQSIVLLEYKPLILSSQEKFEALWAKYKGVPMAFRPEWQDIRVFFAYFNNPKALFFEIGELDGLASATAIIPGLSAVVDFVMFDRVLRGREHTFHAILEDMFDITKASRMTGFIPASRNVSKRLLERLGFKQEGRMRNAVKSSRGYEDLIILGILKGQLEYWSGPIHWGSPAVSVPGHTVLPREETPGNVQPGSLDDNLEQAYPVESGPHPPIVEEQ